MLHTTIHPHHDLYMGYHMMMLYEYVNPIYSILILSYFSYPFIPSILQSSNIKFFFFNSIVVDFLK